MTRMWLRSVYLLACCMLVACSSSPPTKFYILNEVAPAAAAAPATAAPNQIPLRVEPVVIPPELDRPELVTRSGPNRVHVAGTERWAAPIAEQIRRVLSDDLAARLPARMVADPNEPATKEPRRSLTVAIGEFFGNESCAVTLRATWSLTNSHGVSQRGNELVQVPPATACTGELPAAMSRAIGLLADRLAMAVTTD